MFCAHSASLPESTFASTYCTESKGLPPNARTVTREARLLDDDAEEEQEEEEEERSGATWARPFALVNIIIVDGADQTSLAN